MKAWQDCIQNTEEGGNLKHSNILELTSNEKLMHVSHRECTSITGWLPTKHLHWTDECK